MIFDGAKAPRLLGQGPQPLPQAHVIDPTGSIADGHPHATDHLTRPPLAHLMCLSKMSDERRPLASQRALPFF
jgi:hypothetical protein